jgi:hypothetical protein
MEEITDKEINWLVYGDEDDQIIEKLTNNDGENLYKKVYNPIYEYYIL